MAVALFIVKPIRTWWELLSDIGQYIFTVLDMIVKVKERHLKMIPYTAIWDGVTC